MTTPSTTRPSDTGERGDPASATLRSQIAAAVVVAGAFMAPSLSHPDIRGWSWVAVGALVFGGMLSVFGHITAFRTFSGLGLGLATMLVLVVSFAVIDAPDRWTPPFELIPAAGAFVLGLDWRLAHRLRINVTLSSFLVLYAAAVGGERLDYIVTVGWAAAAFTVFSLLEADRRASLPRIHRDAADAARATRPADLISTLVLTAVVAALAAAVLSVPSCQGLLDRTSSGIGEFGDASGSDFGPFDPGAGSPGAGSPGAGSPGAGSPGAGSPGAGTPGQLGEGTPGSPGAGAGNGNGAGSGNGNGAGAGEGGALDVPGQIGGTYVPDPNGRFLVPDEATRNSQVEPAPGAERIPSPEFLPPSDGNATQQRVDPDGWSTTYEIRPDGQVEVTVTDPNGRSTDWRFTERADGFTQVDQLGPDGTVEGTWYYDPEGKTAIETSPPTASADDPATADDPNTADQPNTANETNPPESKDSQSDPPWLWIGLALLALALAIALAWYLRKRPPVTETPDLAPPRWAIALAERLEREGLERGRARMPGESVVSYARELSTEAIPDPRIAAIGEVISEALFSRRDPGPQAQAWAETTFEDVIATNPVPTRRQSRARAG